jgi:acetyltransferase
MSDSWRRELAILEGQLHALDADISAARASAARGRHPEFSFAQHEAPHPRLAGEAVTLPDGRQILIRPIEPEDAGELKHGLEHLSALSAYRRFRSYARSVSPEQLDYLTRVDHVRHEALAALDPVAGRAVGVARYVCDPGDPTQAEVTYVVTDAWQRCGVGSALLERLAASPPHSRHRARPSALRPRT